MSLTAPIRLRVVPRLIPIDGKNVELRSTSNAVEWRNEGDANWQVLVPISELIGPEGPKGDKGDAGQDGIMASIQPGDNVSVDATDPANPVISTPSVSYGISQSLSTSQRLQAQANTGQASELSPQAFGAEADGATNDLAAINDMAAYIGVQDCTAEIVGTFAANSGLLLPENTIVAGRGTSKAIIKRLTSGTFLSSTDATGARLSGITFDLNRAGIGDAGGHGLNLQGSDIVIEDCIVRGYSTRVSDGAGGGTGILVGGATRPANIRLRNSEFYPDQPGSPATTVGWLFDKTDTSFAHGLYAYGVTQGIGYAHELKNDSKHNNLWGLTSEYSNVCVAFGQDTGTGPSYNIAGNILAKSTDKAFSAGFATGNLINGLLHDQTDRPTNVLPAAIELLGGASRNAIFAAAVHGTGANAALVTGDENYIELANFSTGTAIRINAGSKRNVFHVPHPGSRTSIMDAVNDLSGNVRGTADGNVIVSPATGEYMGSLSGRFHFQLQPSGAAFINNHRLRLDSAEGALIGIGTDGALNRLSGFSFAVPGNGTRGGIWHVCGATEDADILRFRGWGGAEKYEFRNNRFQPVGAGVSLGFSAAMWAVTHTERVHYGDSVIDLAGTGSPEGVVVAAIGSTYRRKDGGAGTAFYVKESGTGNTGWVAK